MYIHLLRWAVNLFTVTTIATNIIQMEVSTIILTLGMQSKIRDWLNYAHIAITRLRSHGNSKPQLL